MNHHIGIHITHLAQIVFMDKYSRYRLVRYRIRREIGYNAILSVCMCVCVSVENRLEREIAYSADFL